MPQSAVTFFLPSFLPLSLSLATPLTPPLSYSVSVSSALWQFFVCCQLQLELQLLLQEATNCVGFVNCCPACCMATTEPVLALPLPLPLSALSWLLAAAAGRTCKLCALIFYKDSKTEHFVYNLFAVSLTFDSHNEQQQQPE